MTEKRRRPSRDHLRPVAQIFTDLDSPEPSRRQRAISECWNLAPHVGAILAALLRGLNDDDELVRLQAAKGLLRAFPSARTMLSRLVNNIESNEPKVRLAAIERIITILPNVLAALAGVRPDDSSTPGKQPEPVREDLMEHAGRWVAWTRDRQRILAVADSFADAMAQALVAGEHDPYVKKAPGIALEAGRKPFALLDGESPNIIDDIRKLFPDPQAWLDAPNDSLGGAKPRDLISTDREREVRYLLRGLEEESQREPRCLPLARLHPRDGHVVSSRSAGPPEGAHQHRPHESHSQPLLGRTELQSAI